MANYAADVGWSGFFNNLSGVLEQYGMSKLQAKQAAQEASANYLQKQMESSDVTMGAPNQNAAFSAPTLAGQPVPTGTTGIGAFSQAPQGTSLAPLTQPEISNMQPLPATAMDRMGIINAVRQGETPEPYTMKPKDWGLPLAGVEVTPEGVKKKYGEPKGERYVYDSAGNLIDTLPAGSQASFLRPPPSPKGAGSTAG